MKQIMKMWYIDTMGFYSAAKKNEIMNFPGKCMEAGNTLSEVNQTQRDKSFMFSKICSS